MDGKRVFYSHVLQVMLGVVLLPRGDVEGGRSRDRPRHKPRRRNFDLRRRGEHGAVRT